MWLLLMRPGEKGYGVMRRFASLVLVAVALMTTTALGINAQEATPPSASMEPPESVEIAPGVVADSMLFIGDQREPINYRLHFEPGVTYTIEPSGALELVYVESGELTITLDGVFTVGELRDPDTVGEAIEANLETTVTAGQFFVLQPGVGGEVRNDGDEVAGLSVAGIIPSGLVTVVNTPTD